MYTYLPTSTIKQRNRGAIDYEPGKLFGSQQLMDPGIVAQVVISGVTSDRCHWNVQYVGTLSSNVCTIHVGSLLSLLHVYCTCTEYLTNAYMYM